MPSKLVSKNCQYPPQSPLILYFLGNRHVLDLSQYPLLRSLILHFQNYDLDDSVEMVYDLLTLNKPCPPLQFLTIVFDGTVILAPPIVDENVERMGTVFSGEDSLTLCGEIDSILGDQRNDGEVVASLTLKTSHVLPGQIVENLKDVFEAAFPKLHSVGGLKIDLSIQGKSMRVVVNRRRAHSKSSTHHSIHSIRRCLHLCNFPRCVP